MAETASTTPTGTTATGVVDDKAVKAIANNDYFRFLGEDKVRRVAEVVERSGAVELVNNGRWINPSIRQEVLRILGPELPQISETYAWMVVRRYREMKRFYKEQVEVAEAKRLEEEAKAKVAADKAAKAAAAKVAAAKAATAAPAGSDAPAADAKTGAAKS